jgi:two-component system, cell cycle response regulator
MPDMAGADDMAEQTIRVLLVEDSPTDAAIALEALEQGRKRGQSFAVRHVKRLDEALKSLRSNEFDVVVLDLDLPDSHGLDTLHEVRRAVPEMPIVVCSGLENEDAAIAALQEGAQDYLVKGRATSWITRRTIRLAIERKRTGGPPGE